MHKSLGLRISDREMLQYLVHISGRCQASLGSRFAFEAVTVSTTSSRFTSASLAPQILEQTALKHEALGTQECIQGSSQSHQYHPAAGPQEEQGKQLNASIADQATGIQRAGAGRKPAWDPTKCRLGFAPETLSNHQLSNKNACEGCASPLGNHSSELCLVTTAHRLTCTY